MKMPPASSVIMWVLVAAFAASGCSKPAPKTTDVTGPSERQSKVDPVKPAESFFRVDAPGCNADVFTQIPDKPDLFVGRQMNLPDPAQPCKGKGWSLVLLQMDWTNHRLSLSSTILQTPAHIDKGAEYITSAHDPYIAKFNGEYWIAFECAGEHIIVGSTCIGPFDPNQPGKGMDLDRTYAVVLGKSAIKNDKFFYSASDPKLLTFEDRLYLYWTAIKGWYPPGLEDHQHQWLSIAVRGMELEQQKSGQRLLFGKGMDTYVESYDPAHNVEVWGDNANDPRSNQTVDMFSIMAIGKVIYATAGVGGTGSLNGPPPPPDEVHPGCVVPDPAKAGCFRLAVASSTSPLGEHVFGAHLAPESALPSNTQEYGRLFRQPDGNLFLMGYFLGASAETDKSRALPQGIDYVPLPETSPLVQWMKSP